jgi:hypothetical protein
MFYPVVLQIMAGEYGKEVSSAAEQMTVHMDKYVSGFFRSFEQGYRKLEGAIRSSVAGNRNTRSSGRGAGRGKAVVRYPHLEFLGRPSDSSGSSGAMSAGEDFEEVST